MRIRIRFLNNDGGFSTFDPKTGQLMGVITDYVTYAVLLSSLNKTLAMIPESKRTGALSVYDNALRKVTLIDFIKDNLLVFATGSGLIFLAIVAVILSPLRKTKSAEAKAK